jgi:hypothetical protein
MDGSLQYYIGSYLLGNIKRNKGRTGSSLDFKSLQYESKIKNQINNNNNNKLNIKQIK